VRTGVTPLATGPACSEAMTIIFNAIRRLDSTWRHNDSNGGTTNA
jgi:hypothetical protein